MTRGEPSRRNVLRAGVVVAAAAAGVGRAEGAPAAPAALFSDDFIRARDGVLDGRVSLTGHRWRAFGADGDAPMAIRGGAIGPPRAHVPGGPGGPVDSNPTAAAGYATVDLGGTATRIEAHFRWDRSSSTSSGLAFGSFDFGAGLGNGFPSLQGGANAHLAVTPTSLQFAVFSRGVTGDYQTLVPRGGQTDIVAFRRPQRCDGATVYRSRITIDGDVARIDMDGVSAPLFFQDPRIASVDAANPFWEYYSLPGGSNLPRFVRTAAQRAI